MTKAVTVELPDTVVQQLETAARARQRSVEEVVQEILLREWPVLPPLPEEVEQELAAFASLSGDSLWLLARGTLPTPEQTEVATLNQTAQQRGLTRAEQERQQALIESYDHTLVRRSRAAQLLMQRGYNLSDPQSLYAA
jgi:predicted transcriptional regulator